MCEITLRIGQSGKVALCISFLLFIVSKLSLQKYTKISIFQSLTFCQYTHLLVSIAEKQEDINSARLGVLPAFHEKIGFKKEEQVMLVEMELMV